MRALCSADSGRPFSLRLWVLAVTLAAGVEACSGKGGGGPTAPGTGQVIEGRYMLAQINQSTPGQLVTLANPDGRVIGLYRFDPSALVLDAGQHFVLGLSFSDDKTGYTGLDNGTFQQAGTGQGGALQLRFTSGPYGDSFIGIVLQDIVSIKYDFDGDGQAETTFGFRRVG